MELNWNKLLDFNPKVEQSINALTGVCDFCKDAVPFKDLYPKRFFKPEDTKVHRGWICSKCLTFDDVQYWIIDEQDFNQ